MKGEGRERGRGRKGWSRMGERGKDVRDEIENRGRRKGRDVREERRGMDERQGKGWSTIGERKEKGWGCEKEWEGKGEIKLKSAVKDMKQDGRKERKGKKMREGMGREREGKGEKR